MINCLRERELPHIQPFLIDLGPDLQLGGFRSGDRTRRQIRGNRRTFYFPSGQTMETCSACVRALPLAPGAFGLPYGRA